MNAQTRLIAALVLIATLGLAACSGGDEPSVVSEARASTTPSTFDYGWRTPESPTAVRDGTVYEFN